ncbi:hypothetical protein Hanom_Chr05g00396801 [Helianthus anomalus]
MGARFSCKSSETDVTTRSTPRKTRVVHLDGSLVDYQDPTTVDQVLRNFPNHFLCTPVQIIQAGLVPLRLDHQLRLLGASSVKQIGEEGNRAVRHRQHLGDQERWRETGGGSPKREGGEREGVTNQ